MGRTDQVTGVLEGKIGWVVGLSGENVTVEVTRRNPGGAGVRVVNEMPHERTAEGGWRIKLGDLYAIEPRSVGLIFHVEGVAALGDLEIGRVTVHSDILHAKGVEHPTVALPVIATLDCQDHVVPEI